MAQQFIAQSFPPAFKMGCGTDRASMELFPNGSSDSFPCSPDRLCHPRARLLWIGASVAGSELRAAVRLLVPSFLKVCFIKGRKHRREPIETKGFLSPFCNLAMAALRIKSWDWESGCPLLSYLCSRASKHGNVQILEPRPTMFNFILSVASLKVSLGKLANAWFVRYWSGHAKC